MKLRNRAVAAASTLGLAFCSMGLAALPAGADDSTDCTVQFNTNPASDLANGYQEMPPTIDFGGSDTFVETLDPSYLTSSPSGPYNSSFSDAQVVIDGDSASQTAGFDWDDYTPPVAGATEEWTAPSTDFTAGHSYSVDPDLSYATTAAGDICSFLPSSFVAKADTEVPNVTFVRRGAKLAIIPLVKQYDMASQTYIPNTDPVQLWLLGSDRVFHQIRSGVTNRRGLLAFHVVAPRHATYLVQVPSDNAVAPSHSSEYGA